MGVAIKHANDGTHELLSEIYRGGVELCHANEPSEVIEKIRIW
jgi:hypothetical protein